MPQRLSDDNLFLTLPIWRVFLNNVLPITAVMLMSGLMNVVDAIFLGYYVGANALTAISLIFPGLMIILALSTILNGGMASLLARALGASRREYATAIFAGAHGLALSIGCVLIVCFLIGGHFAFDLQAREQPEIVNMAKMYLGIAIFAVPVQLLLGLHSEAWRNEGKAGQLAILSIVVTVTNILFNFIFIDLLNLGVAGSAWGTVAAQALGLSFLLILRVLDSRMLSLLQLLKHNWRAHWLEIVALGAPVSLSLIGISLVSLIVLFALQLSSIGAEYESAVAAYGVVTRILSFAFLPIMAIALSTQTIVGNNIGAGQIQRSNKALLMGVVTSFAYCAVIVISLEIARKDIGLVFVKDSAIVKKVSHILLPILLVYFFTGPIMVLTLYFQAIGQPVKAAILTLIKPFILSPVLILSFALVFKPDVIWFAFPTSDAIAALIAVLIVLPMLKKFTKNLAFGWREE